MLDSHGQSCPLDEVEPAADAAGGQAHRRGPYGLCRRPGPPLRDRPRDGHAPTPPSCGWGAHRAPLPRWCVPPRPPLPATTATTSCRDLQALAVPVLAHRLLPTREAQIGGGPRSRWCRRSWPGCPCRRRREPAAALMGALAACGAALHGLTTRGRSFLAAGAATAAAAVVLGQRDCCGSVSSSWHCPGLGWVVARTRYRLACTRRLEPARVAAGQQATSSSASTTSPACPTGLCSSRTGALCLGSRPRFVLERVEPRATAPSPTASVATCAGRFPSGRSVCG
jgi:hypothetical protein